MENILVAFAQDIALLKVSMYVLVAFLLGFGIGKKF